MRYLPLLVRLAMAGCAGDYDSAHYSYEQGRYPYCASGYGRSAYYGRPAALLWLR
jgi:hypothetical protein